MSTRQFKLFNRTELQHLADRLRHECGGWAEEWFCGEAVEPQVRVMSQPGPDAFDGMRWEVRLGADGSGAGVGTTVGDQALRRQLTGVTTGRPTGAGRSMLELLEDGALEALLARLMGPGAARQGEVPPAHEYQAPGNGFFMAHVRFADLLELRFLVWPTVARAWLVDAWPNPASEQVVPVSRLDALDAQTIGLEVIAGGAEVAFDELRALSEGFVIKLDRNLDQPLQVRLAGDGVLCAGHLGVEGDRRAVQVATKN